MASNSGHCPQGQTHSGLSECDSRPPVSAESANNDRVESPPLELDSNLRELQTADKFATVHNVHLLQKIILIAPGGHHNHGSHVYFVCVWTAAPYVRDLQSQPGYVSDGSRTICMLGGSHAVLPSSRIFKRVL